MSGAILYHNPQNGAYVGKNADGTWATTGSARTILSAQGSTGPDVPPTDVPDVITHPSDAPVGVVESPPSV